MSVTLSKDKNFVGGKWFDAVDGTHPPLCSER